MNKRKGRIDESMKEQQKFHFPEWFSKIWFPYDISKEKIHSLVSKYKTMIYYLKNALEETAFIVLINREGQIVYASDQFLQLLSFEQDEIVGTDYLSLQHNAYQKYHKDSFSTFLYSEKADPFEIYMKTKNENLIILETNVFPFSIDGEFDLFLLSHRDMTPLKKVERAIEELVIVDTLTGLPNREKFEQDAMQLLENKAGNEPFAIFFLDLDRFKFYNDTLGHSTGDKLIKAIAHDLSKIEYPRMQVYRYGGDEFSILVKSPTSIEEIETIAEKVLQVFRSPFLVKGNELYITASIGISYYPEYGNTYSDIVHQAEIAMHYAKERGKNDFQFYHPSIRTKHDEKLRIEKRLRIATEKKAFTIHYQPQIDLKKKKVIGVEALLRWTDEELGAVAPSMFIPLAEETGLITPIGDWVLEEACRQGKIWHDQGYDFRIGINISPIQFQRPDFVSKVKSIVNKVGIQPQYVDLEITENDLLFNQAENFKTLERLKEIGLTISIDDFGTGYSSLSYLRKFPIDTLKIDKSFIRDVTNNVNDQAIVTSIIQLAHNMNLTVIAEGVETKDMVKFLKKHDCDEMQGFLYSKPLPADELTTFIEKRNPVELLNG